MRTYPRDLYEALKLPQPYHLVSQEDIKHAFWNRRKEIDPQGLGTPHEELTRINLAYKVLGDPHERRLYDDFLAGKPAAPKVPGATFRRKAGAPGPSPTAARPFDQPDQAPAAPYTPPVSSLAPREPAAYIRWLLGTAESRTRVLLALAALVGLPALVVTVAIAPLLYEVLAAVVLAGIMYVVVRSWTSMRLLHQSFMVAGAALVAFLSYITLATWPRVPEALAAALVVFLIYRLRLYMIVVFIAKAFL